MKQWRVGTLSMGVALIVFGATLFVSQAKGLESFGLLLDWWPLIFILLGLELLVYLAVSRMTQPVVKYDLFSIFVVGFLCVVGLGGAVIASTGVMQEVRYAVSAEERYEQLQDVVENVPESVARVIVQNRSGWEVAVDKAAGASVHVFGGYRYTSYAAEEQDRDAAKPAVTSVRTVGDTMYVEIADPPRHKGLRSDFPRLHLTVVVPEHVQTEVYGHHQLM